MAVSKAAADAARDADLTGLLKAWGQGDREAAEKLIPLVYADLRRQAAGHLRRERRDHTLRPTALVHETYLRLEGRREIQWKNRAQFFAVAAKVMRRILVDHARRRGAAKRAGSWCRVTRDEAVAAPESANVDVVALEEALEALSALDPDKTRMVELRFFGGLSLEETAQVMGVSPATVTREWRMARAWLYRRLAEHAPRGGRPGRGASSF